MSLYHVTFGTPDYMQKYLEPWCAGTSPNRIIVPIPQCPWLDAVRQKPRILLDILRGLNPDSAIIYSDLDAALRPGAGEAMAQKCNGIPGLALMDTDAHYGYPLDPPFEWLTGAIYLPRSKMSWDLLISWIDGLGRDATAPDGLAFAGIMGLDDRVKALDSAIWGWIPTRPNGEPSGIPGDKALIIHGQASRSMRR